jgi:hypothetical protein
VKNYTLPIVLALLAAGCKKPQQDQSVKVPDQIYQEYTVNYFPKIDSTKVYASFKQGSVNGLGIVFWDESVVRVNGDTTSHISSDPYSGDRFVWYLAGQPDVAMTIKRKDNSTLTNTVSRSLMGELDVEMDSVLFTNDTIRVRWKGAPLDEKEESIEVMMEPSPGTDTHGRDLARYPIADANDPHSFVFEYETTHRMWQGKYDITVKKRRDMPLQQRDGTAGGKIYMYIIVKKTLDLRF